MPFSLQMANTLAGAPRLRLLLPGGEPRTDEMALTGPLAEASLAAPVSALTMVVTTDGADQEETNALVAAGTVVHKA